MSHKGALLLDLCAFLDDTHSRFAAVSEDDIQFV